MRKRNIDIYFLNPHIAQLHSLSHSHTFYELLAWLMNRIQRNLYNKEKMNCLKFEKSEGPFVSILFSVVNETVARIQKLKAM